jgi:hypothetical protein
MTTMNLPKGLVILLYTTEEGANRERWFRPLAPFGGQERTCAVDPPVTLTPVPAVRAAEAAERYAARGFTNITIVEFRDPCGDGHDPQTFADGEGSSITKCARCAQDVEEAR